ncbi:Uncharacterised protein [Mycobacteroides abscessus subsp. abscessus]|nr:Uncharacterised protein [Mycobacteroides abscessus subsp. abscessus]
MNASDLPLRSVIGPRVASSTSRVVRWLAACADRPGAEMLCTHSNWSATTASATSMTMRPTPRRSRNG